MPSRKKSIIGESGLPFTQAASANQDVTNNISLENPKERPPCLALKLKQSMAKEPKPGEFHSNRAKAWWIPCNRAKDR